MNTDEKIITFACGVTVLILIVAIIVSTTKQSQRADDCKLKDGVLIKGVDGFMCIKKEVVIK